MKKCPFCAEEIQDDAIKCRFCGEFLKKKKWWKNCFFGCLIAIVASILLVIFLGWFLFFLLKVIVFKLFFAAPNLPDFSYSPSVFPGIDYFFKDLKGIFQHLWEILFNSSKYKTI